MTSHCITWHDTTQAITSHQMTWPPHQMTWHDMTCHVATNHSSPPHVTSQPTTLLHLTPQTTSWHQNRSHHHGTAEGSFTAKKWFGHRAGRSPCAHSIGKFFLCYTSFFFWNFSPRLAWELLVFKSVQNQLGRDYNSAVASLDMRMGNM